VKPVLFQTKPALFFAAALGFALFCAQAAPRMATAYDGLMSGSSTSDGYDGLLAPSQPARGAPRGAQEPPGYEGLIRGAIPQRPVEAPETDNEAAQPQRPSTAGRPPAGTAPATRPGVRQPVQTARPDLPMTPRPGRINIGRVGSAEQLRMLAALNGTRLDLSRVADGIVPSPTQLGIKEPQQLRIGGMLPAELMAATEIERVMASVNHPQLTPDQRQTNARNGYSRLMMLADGIMTRSGVPDSLYTKMGMSEVFLEEEREANERALTRFEEAFKILRPLQ
jgi:hypothetical protein